MQESRGITQAVAWLVRAVQILTETGLFKTPPCSGKPLCTARPRLPHPAWADRLLAKYRRQRRTQTMLLLSWEAARSSRSPSGRYQLFGFDSSGLSCLAPPQRDLIKLWGRPQTEPHFPSKLDGANSALRFSFLHLCLRTRAPAQGLCTIPGPLNPSNDDCSGPYMENRP